MLLCALLFFLVPSLSNAQQRNSPSAPPSKVVASEATATGSITGRVLTDDGRPLANASVMAFGIGVVARPNAVMTDADGKFEITDLRLGAYNLQASSPGYVAVPDVGAELGAPRYYRIGESATLTLTKGGVITGTVLDAEGQPVVAVNVRAIRVRKPSDPPSALINFMRERMTDDRGSYRIYGLAPGVYVIAVGGGFQGFNFNNLLSDNAPTYYPSATRDTAAELTINAGEELTGIDIRYRNERGHTISGFISGTGSETDARASGINIMLLRTNTGTQEAFAFARGDGNDRSFALNGIADGEYTLTALMGRSNNEPLLASRKVTVRGGDVTGVELKLEPLGYVSGNVILEPPPKVECANKRGTTLEEIVINARRREKEPPDASMFSFFRQSLVTPNAKGEFKLGNMRSGNYLLNFQLPGDDWFVRSIVMPAPATTGAKATAQSKPTNSGTFTLKTSERITGVTINIGQGAAHVRGRVAPAIEGAKLPAGLLVHLVPVEPERREDALRYAEAAVAADGQFALNGIAPGHYWLIARVAVIETDGTERRGVAFDANERMRLRREAESAGVKIELLPCQRLADYVLNYGATSPK